MSCVASVTALMLSIMNEPRQFPEEIWGSTPHPARHPPIVAEVGARGLVAHIKAPRRLLDYPSIDRQGGCNARNRRHDNERDHGRPRNIGAGLGDAAFRTRHQRGPGCRL